jgi:hypothetical protein
MESYHTTNSLSSGGYSDNPVGEMRSGRGEMTNPYAYEVIPPIGRLLELICEERSVGGCFRPGNRALARRMGYAGASQIPYLLSQLACDGWISYDPLSGVIMLLRTPDDRSIGSIDRFDQYPAESEAIDRIDRGLPRSDAADLCDRSPNVAESPCMESTTTRIIDSESVVVNGGDARGGRKGPITARDHPILLLLIELGLTPGPGVFDRGMAARDWTPQQVRDRYAYDKPRIENSGGKKHWGIFWTAFMAGELAPAPPDPAAPIDPASYAGDSLYRLGSDTSGLAPPADAPEVDEPPMSETPRDRAHRLLGPWTAENHQAQIRDSMFLQCRLVAGDSDEQACEALEAYRKAVRR